MEISHRFHFMIHFLMIHDEKARQLYWVNICTEGLLLMRMACLCRVCRFSLMPSFKSQCQWPGVTLFWGEAIPLSQSECESETQPPLPQSGSLAHFSFSVLCTQILNQIKCKHFMSTKTEKKSSRLIFFNL